ncbi:hypothetical protein GCM10010425_69450 [Streptomyces spororaveus]|uniref:Uncharacterized protein n=1 Tax=Streptomyces spororaveus TaxID=284039 RepID=A0ABQ3TLY6_9ACTN|nr:hypothetical protein Sspor_69860 [Streptomyces spororaveus]
MPTLDGAFDPIYRNYFAAGRLRWWTSPSTAVCATPTTTCNASATVARSAGGGHYGTGLGSTTTVPALTRWTAAPAPARDPRFDSAIDRTGSFTLSAPVDSGPPILPARSAAIPA